MKGILFQPWKTKAIVESPVGKVWQTRRTGGLEEINGTPDKWVFTGNIGRENNRYFKNGREFRNDSAGTWEQRWAYLKPRYLPGETVYLKEAVTIYDDTCDWRAVYKDNAVVAVYPPEDWIRKHVADDGLSYQKMFMPAWAARYFILITGVAPCRTRNIKPLDCFAEGIKASIYPERFTWPGTQKDYISPELAYFALYDSINGNGAHERNWDWKYSFIKVEKSNSTLPVI